MTTLSRKLKRLANPIWEGKPQAFEDLPCGGYTTVHPTKGFRKMSGRRIKAQEEMFARFGFVR